jgi:hypothetical protein
MTFQTNGKPGRPRIGPVANDANGAFAPSAPPPTWPGVAPGHSLHETKNAADGSEPGWVLVFKWVVLLGDLVWTLPNMAATMTAT